MPDALQSIRVLPDHVVNKIAAGEVVERPAAVLKELVENALDAAAGQIDVTAVDGGRVAISVADDGSGMRRDDLLLAVERHATSKIRDIDDIDRIGTLGFRGEALAAIAAVSRFRMLSRTAGDPGGAELLIAAGKVQDLREAGCPPGTTVEVRNLFFNVPARRKFLRTGNTETAHIRRCFVNVALAHPGVGFTLTLDRRRVFTLPARNRFEERLRALFPGLDRANLRPLDMTGNGIAVSGCVGLPAISRADRSDQYFFVNGRPAGSATLHAAVRSACRNLLPADRHPFICLFVKLPPDEVDVNVHPTKKEVRFRQPSKVGAACTAAITAALAAAPAPRPTHERAAAERHGPLPDMDRFLDGLQRPSWPARGNASALRPLAAPLAEIGRSPCPGSTPDQSRAGAPPWSWYRCLGMVADRYVVLETNDGLALMDPHAAHERVLYEKLRDEFRQRQTASQPLLSPVTLELSSEAAERISDRLELLRRMGFGIAEFGDQTFIIDALPSGLDHQSPRDLVEAIAADLDDQSAARATVEERIIRAACHAAVKSKATGAWPPRQIESLIEQLGRTEMPYTCPHGRPTLVNIPVQELNRKFGRV